MSDIASTHTSTLELPRFLRAFAIQDQPRLMAFLGAGASVSAGIPSAIEMTWMFKRLIYCSETGAGQEALRDLTLERNQHRLQEYFDQKRGYPELWSDNEYSFYFEKAFPDPSDRRQFIRKMLRAGRPSIGHECLAALVAQTKFDWIWTTNFDDLAERTERVEAERRLHQVGPESATRLEGILDNREKPVLVKLHGDYRYDNLQNTADEVQHLDARLRDVLVQMCQGNGLLVVGYSGRDESVMSTLEAAASKGGFHRGIYWCIREGSRPSERVRILVEMVFGQTKRGGFIEISSFDDFLYRLYKQCELKDQGIDDKAEVLFEQRRTFALASATTLRKPLKLNAIRMVDYPTSPYKFQTSIKNWKELRETLANQSIVAGLLGGHVIAFGNRERIRTTFESKMSGPIEVTDIRPRDLIRTNSVMMGLFYDIIRRNLVEKWGLLQIGRNTFYLRDPQTEDKKREFTFEHRGKHYTVSTATNADRVVINEAFSFQLDFHEDDLWFILEPTVVVTTDGYNPAPKDLRKTITNSTVSGRYNDDVHKMLLFWHYYLGSKSNPITFMFPPNEGTAVQLVLDESYAYSSVGGR